MFFWRESVDSFEAEMVGVIGRRRIYATLRTNFASIIKESMFLEPKVICSMIP